MNKPRKVMIGHTQGQRTVKKRNWIESQLPWLLFWYSPSSLVNKDLHLPLTERCWEGEKQQTNNPKPVLEEIQSSL